MGPMWRVVLVVMLLCNSSLVAVNAAGQAGRGAQELMVAVEGGAVYSDGHDRWDVPTVSGIGQETAVAARQHNEALSPSGSLEASLVGGLQTSVQRKQKVVGGTIASFILMYVIIGLILVLAALVFSGMISKSTSKKGKAPNKALRVEKKPYNNGPPKPEDSPASDPNTAEFDTSQQYSPDSPHDKEDSATARQHMSAKDLQDGIIPAMDFKEASTMMHEAKPGLASAPASDVADVADESNDATTTPAATGAAEATTAMAAADTAAAAATADADDDDADDAPEMPEEDLTAKKTEGVSKGKK